MREDIKNSLLEAGIRDDSVFWEYVGQIKTFSAEIVDNISKKVLGSQTNSKTLNRIKSLLTQITTNRLNHFNFLVNTNSVVDISPKYLAYVQREQAEIKKLLEYLKHSLNNNFEIDALRAFNGLETRLKNLESMDKQFHGIVENSIKKEIDTARLRFQPKTQGITGIQTQNPVFPSFSPPNQGVPDHRTAYVQRLQPIRTVAPQPVKPQYKYDVTMQPPQPMPPPRKTPVMRQGGPNPIPARRRKEEKENRKNTKEKGKFKKLVITAVATVACIVGLAFYTPGKSVAPPTPSVPTQQPKITQSGELPSVTKNPLIIDPTVTIPVETPENNPIVVTTPAPVQTQEARPKYDKHSLMYCLEFMDDEMVSFVANSLRNSIDDFSSVNMGMYGNGCNMTFSSDREYVAHVFAILDSRAASMRYNSNCDKFAIAPQMEQLSGDVSKYLIAKAIGESGKYDKGKYEISDIDIHYYISYGETSSFEYNTIEEKKRLQKK